MSTTLDELKRLRNVRTKAIEAYEVASDAMRSLEGRERLAAFDRMTEAERAMFAAIIADRDAVLAKSDALIAVAEAAQLAVEGDCTEYASTLDAALKALEGKE